VEVKDGATVKCGGEMESCRERYQTASGVKREIGFGVSN
jgi:hypothetical protein